MAKKDEPMQWELGLRESPAMAGALVALSSPCGDDTRVAQATTTFALPCWAKSARRIHGAASEAQAWRETKDLTQKVQMCPIQHEHKSRRNPPRRSPGWEKLSCWDQSVSVSNYGG